MTRRFVAIAVPPMASDTQISQGIKRAKSFGLSVCLSIDRLAVLASDDIEVNALDGACGAVIGDVFRRHIPTRAFDHHQGATEEVTRILVNDRAQQEMWGDYVAIYFDADGSLRFLHSPCGSVNLYYLPWENGLLVASDAALLLAIAGRRRSLNWVTIAHNIVWDDVSSSETCIEGIREVRCGESGRWSGGPVSIETVWDPWRFTETEVSIWTPDEAIELVRREILRCVGARNIGGTRYAIDLSGGLDSSIIAAACVAAGMEVMGINLYNPDTEGDERHFARCVANHLQLELKEGIPKAGDIDLNICARGHLPRPYVRAFVQAFDRSSFEIATNLGATAFVNGGGGDSVFCHLQSSGPVVDALKSVGRAPSVIRTAYDVSRAAQCNVWDVVKKAGKKLWRGSPADRMLANDEFVTARCMTLANMMPPPLPPPRQHPLPGKVEQVQGIFRALYNVNGFARSDHMKGIFPLLSQPLVEACLRIPTWLSLGDGRNRLIARLAMEQKLPAIAIWRTSKGGLGQLQRDVIRANREHIRAKLLDGQLVSQGFIDRSAIENELKDDQSYRIESLYRLMRLYDIEIWCAT